MLSTCEVFVVAAVFCTLISKSYAYQIGVMVFFFGIHIKINIHDYMYKNSRSTWKISAFRTSFFIDDAVPIGGFASNDSVSFCMSFFVYIIVDRKESMSVNVGSF